ncbi:MAG TPA: prepilin peptidase [Phycisphaerales bacterium]|nr:prepilin peptidase [Phycisphaerales bacterium]
MTNGDFLIWSAALTGLLFVFALGCIVGSFINVVAYRLPLGMGLVMPPSSCPACGTRLTWRENFPVLGWLWLGGKCRFCRSAISAQYPMIEFIVGLLFAGLFALWYMQPSVLTWAGLDVSVFRDEFVRLGVWRTWPFFVSVLFLIGSLVAITLIDARTFMIPLAIPVWATFVGIAAHLGNAIYFQLTRSAHQLGEMKWAIPTPSGWALGGTIGATAGLMISLALLYGKILKRSFADYEEWEKAHATKEAAGGASGAGETNISTDHKGSEASGGAGETGAPVRMVLMRTLFLTGPAIALMFLGFTIGLPLDRPMQGMIAGAAGGLLVGMFLRRLVPDAGHHASDPVWIQYPYARREMVREITFLLPVVALGVAGALLTRESGWLGQLAANPPLWVKAVGGSLLGYLIGAGMIWFTRIAATLVFGREAMGLGDVHLMGAVGAVLGWVTPVLAFFTAPFLGLAWAAMSVVFGRFLKRVGTALPYGPHLAMGTLLALYGRPVYEIIFSLIASPTGETIHLP